MEVTRSKQNRKMHKLLLLLIMLFTASLTFAQSEPETAIPLMNMEAVRKVVSLDIEGKIYGNVTIFFKSITPDYFISDKYKVKVRVVDSSGKSIYKKTFKSVFLYVFSNGQVQVGKKNFNQIIVQKSVLTGDNVGMIREKEGIF